MPGVNVDVKKIGNFAPDHAINDIANGPANDQPKAAGDKPGFRLDQSAHQHNHNAQCQS